VGCVQHDDPGCRCGDGVDVADQATLQRLGDRPILAADDIRMGNTAVTSPSHGHLLRGEVLGGFAVQKSDGGVGCGGMDSTVECFAQPLPALGVPGVVTQRADCGWIGHQQAGDQSPAASLLVNSSATDAVIGTYALT
jgi:hypothetical protein